MKKSTHILLIISIIIAVDSCQKEPFLQLSSPSSITISNQGGTQNISMTTNRPWTVSSSDSWCKVSPASGEAAEAGASITVTCDPNTTYDSRNCTITINAGGITQSIAVSQETNLGLIVSQTSYNLSSEAQTIEVEVRANVKYTVEIDAACKDWIKHVSTRALGTNILVLQISENVSYDERVGIITIRQADGILSETAYIKQEAKNVIFVANPEYSLTKDNQLLRVEIQATDDYEVHPEVEWIHFIETRGITSSSLILSIDENATFENRIGKVTIRLVNNSLSGTITVRQEGIDRTSAIPIEDKNFKALLVNDYDINNDGDISYEEALLIKQLYIYTDDIESVQGIEFMYNLNILSCTGLYRGKLSSIDVTNNPSLNYLICDLNNLTDLDISNNSSLLALSCRFNQLKELDFSMNPALKCINCEYNQLTELDVSKNPVLKEFTCGFNQLLGLDVSNNGELLYLECEFNPIKSFDLSKNGKLKRLKCCGINLSSLDITNNLALQELNCNDCKLLNIDVSNNIDLRSLECAQNELTALDITNNKELSSLDCSHNQLTNLDLSINTKLKSLRCEYNKLDKLDISKIVELMTFSCHYNRLTSLDLSSSYAFISPPICGLQEKTVTVYYSVGQPIDVWRLPIENENIIWKLKE